jgi:hypothetical protein
MTVVASLQDDRRLGLLDTSFFEHCDSVMVIGILRLRLVFALEAQRPVLAQDDRLMASLQDDRLMMSLQDDRLVDDRRLGFASG